MLGYICIASAAGNREMYTMFFTAATLLCLLMQLNFETKSLFQNSTALANREELQP